MQVQVSPKDMNQLEPTDILFQTLYWAKVKSRLGFKPLAFDIYSPSSGERSDLLVLLQHYGQDLWGAYVPQGPEYVPYAEDYGVFLEELSQDLAQYLESRVAFIRYDLPWQSQYAQEMLDQNWAYFPEDRLREMRMNMGTHTWNLRKASMDMTVASTLVVDIRNSEEKILARMKPKTRYNIGLASRKGVRVEEASQKYLPRFYELYLQTAERNGFPVSGYEHFVALFHAHQNYSSHPEVLFLLAWHNHQLLAGAIVGISRGTAYYLYGASSNSHRNLMGSYALHWEAMRQARLRGCTSYDMGAVAPAEDPQHPFYGLYRFKTGFGGSIQIHSGSWDYPFSTDKYFAFKNADVLSRGV